MTNVLIRPCRKKYPDFLATSSLQGHLKDISWVLVRNTHQSMYCTWPHRAATSNPYHLSIQELPWHFPHCTQHIHLHVIYVPRSCNMVVCFISSTIWDHSFNEPILLQKPYSLLGTNQSIPWNLFKGCTFSNIIFKVVLSGWTSSLFLRHLRTCSLRKTQEQSTTVIKTLFLLDISWYFSVFTTNHWSKERIVYRNLAAQQHGQLNKARKMVSSH